MVSRTEFDIYASFGTSSLITCVKGSKTDVGGLEKAIQEVIGEESLPHGWALFEGRTIINSVSGFRRLECRDKVFSDCSASLAASTLISTQAQQYLRALRENAKSGSLWLLT